MNRELALTESFEKKKTHLGWCCLAILVAVLSYDGTPIKVLGLDASLSPRPAILILLILNIYLIISFWFESRRVKRANSQFAQGKEIADVIAEMKLRANSVDDFLDRIEKQDFGPVPYSGMKPVFDDFLSRSKNYRDHLEKIPEFQSGSEITNGVRNNKTEFAVHIHNLLLVQDEFERRLGEFPFSEADPVVQGARQLEKCLGSLSGFREELSAQIAVLAEKMTRLSNDILAEGRAQWRLVEVWPPMGIGILASVFALATLIAPDCIIALKAATASAIG